ncbi:MAG: metallophosphoesterase family protein [Candidatus Thorarchaeota archaeon]
MRSVIAVISDIHANLIALRAVLTDIHSLKEVKAAQIFCLGDLVGYYTQPIPVIHLTLAKCNVVIKGNHDHAAALGVVPDYYRPDSLQPLDWTNQNLSIRERRILHALPIMHTERIENKKIMCIHGGPEYPLDQYVFQENEADLDSSFEFMELIEVDTLFLGHTHIPFKIEKDNRIICNPGSVGQPRDGDPRASYIIYDIGSGDIEMRRVDYDPTAVIKGIEKHRFSTYLGERLLIGK